MIDTHCHLTYEGLVERVDDVVADAGRHGVDRMISVGTSLDDSEKALAVAKRFENVYCTAGVHPHHADGEFDAGRLAELANDPRVVAFGEMGLDRHYDEPSIAAQRACFEGQLEVAARHERSLPIVIHNREATEETLGVLRGCGIVPERFVFHCFTGRRDELDAILDFGAWVSFTGIVTFKGAADVAAASDLVPIERMMIETDSPYLTPAPYRKIRTNEPKYVAEVAKFLAARRGMSVEAFTDVVDANADRFFGLG